VTCYSRRVDKVVCQEFNPTTTTRSGSRHWRRADWLHILNLRRTDDYFQGRLWQYIVALLSGGRGGFSAGYFRQLGGCSGGSLGLRRQAFNGHRLGDGASFGFGPYQQKTTGLVTLGGYDYSLRITVFVQCTHLLQYWPLAT
jgi:hypothetical protein